MTYDLDWKNPDYWQHDGTLSYDEGNNVIFLAYLLQRQSQLLQ